MGMSPFSQLNQQVPAVPNPVPNTGDTAGNKIDGKPCPNEADILLGRQTVNEIENENLRSVR